jgi:hypothetical protein
VREDGRLVVGKGWKERIYNREEWKKLLRTTRNRRILRMPMECMNELHKTLICTQCRRLAINKIFILTEIII